MAKKPPPKKKVAAAKTKPTKPVAKMRPKAKIPTLGGGLIGLGGTGAQGMMP